MTDRRPRLLAALVLLGAAVVLAHLVPGFSNSYVDAGIRDSLHVLGFAGVAAVLFEMAGGGAARRCLLALVVAIVLGVIAESVQHFVGRQLDPADVLRDVAGAVTAIAARVLWQRATGPGLRTLSVAIASIAFLPLIYWSVLYTGFVLRLPLVADPADPRYSRLLSAVNASIVPAHGSSVPEVLLEESVSSGVMIDVVAKDWSAYHTIVIDIAITGAEGAVVDVDVSDGLHPGYRTRHHLGRRAVGSGMTELRLDIVDVNPVGGRPPLSATHVERIWILGRYAHGAATMRLDRIRLE